jgi:diguanylate cyclase (GGDEF)-like protein/PAS domain S-box-containing protein
MPAWRLLIVDDEREVHAVTELSLRHLEFDGRPVEFLHAYSGAEARRIIAQTDDIHLILLDVVMETDDAGLQVVDYLRREIDNTKIRIVLRTGQPGLAPESEIIARYDVNDYRLKTELTHQKLTTSVVTALRGYQELLVQGQALAGETAARIRKTIDATAFVARAESAAAFATAALRQFTAMLGAQCSGVLCALSPAGPVSPPQILAGSGRFDGAAALPPEITIRVSQAFVEQQSRIESDTVFYLRTPNARELVIYLEPGRSLDETEALLLDLFAANVGLCFDNVEMIGEIVAANETLEDRVDARTRELADRMARFRAILDCSPAGVLIVERGSKSVSFANRAFLTMMGLEQGQVARICLPEHFIDPEAAALYRQTLQSDEPMSAFEAVLRPIAGEPFWAMISVGRVAATDRPLQATWIHDISERKARAEALERMVRVDDLTGLTSRKQFLDEFAHELKRARRYGHPLSVMMIDIDRFKEINDTYGHAAGDAALRAVAQCCMGLLRDCDLVGRVGGDEFAVLLRETELEVAASVGERLRQTIAEHGRNANALEEPLVTVSVGLTALTPGDIDIDCLLLRADAALYHSKREGRDRVTITVPGDAPAP